MKRIAVLLFFAVLACVAVGYSLLSSQQGASADPALSLDSVDIGKNEAQTGWPCSAVYSSDETNHSAADWGISVWNACGGGYGFPSVSGDTTARVTWQGLEWDGSGSQVDGTNSPEASVTLNSSGYQLGTLVIEALDGQAATYESNSFEVRVNGTLVYTYHATQGGGEQWVIHTIDLVNPGNSSRSPVLTGSSFDAGTGIHPCTTSLVVEIENIGDAWSGWYDWGQLAITYLELFAAEPEAMCADLEKVSFSPVGISNGDDVPVSEDIWFKLEEVLHNIGPWPGPVHAWSSTWAVPPAGGEVSYHCKGGEVITINGGTVDPNCEPCTVYKVGWPDVLDVHINVPLPISEQITLLTEWDIHCLEPSTHTWHFENVVEAKEPDVYPDPEPGNNTKQFDLTVDCVAEADVGISQTIVNPPTNIDLSQEVPITLRKVLHNVGPYTPGIAEDHAGLPWLHKDGANVLPANSTWDPQRLGLVVERGDGFVTITLPRQTEGGQSNLSGIHAMVTLEDAEITGVLDSGAEGVGFVALNSPQVNGQYGLENLGDDGLAEITQPTFTDEVDFIGDAASVDPGQAQGVTSTSELEFWVATTTARNGFKMELNYTGPCPRLRIEHISVGQQSHSDKPGFKLDQYYVEKGSIDPGYANFSLVNYGDELPLAECIWIQKTASAPQGCTVHPVEESEQAYLLPVSEDVVIDEQFTIHCSEPSTHGPFTFDNAVGPFKEPHVIDPNESNDTAHTELSVNVWAEADVKIVSQDIDAPSEVAVSENVPITVLKTLHNNGPYGPVEVEVGAVIDSVDIGNGANPCADDYSADEDAHEAEGWGHTTERDCTGGNYGKQDPNYDDSRLVWHSTSPAWDSSSLPADQAAVTMRNPGFQLGTLRINALDGIANGDCPGGDSFDVYVNGVLVYSYTSADPAPEIWVIHSIDLDTPGNSGRYPIVSGSSASGVNALPDLFASDVEVRIESTSPGECQWGGFQTYGQLAVAWMQLLAGDTYQEVIPLPVSTEVVVEEDLVIHCSEASTHTFEFENKILRIKDEHVVDSDLGNNSMPGQITVDCIGTSDVKITSVDIPDLTSGEASEDKSVTLGAVVHNNGPYGPVATHMRLTFNVAPQCTLWVVFPGYDPIEVPSGVPMDAPISHDLPVSEDLPLSVDLIGHCSVAGLQMFSGCAEVVIDQEHVVDPDPDNNKACTEASWAVYGESDVKIVTQQFLTPPAEIDVSANVPVTLRKVLHNDGPYAEPVEVTVSKTATAAADCTISPATHEEQVVVPYGTNVTVDETFTIHCSKPSSHTFSVTNVVSEPKDPYVIDPDMGNNGPKTTSLTVTAWGYSDLKVVEQYVADPPAQIPLSQDVVITLHKVIHNNGTWGPVDAETTTEVTVAPAGKCTVRPAVHTQQFTDVPVSVDILHHEPFVVHCSELGEYTFTFDDTVEVKDPHVKDLVPENDSEITELTGVEATALADVKITSVSFVDPPTEIKVGTPQEVTVRKVIHNNGPWESVDIDLDATASAPTNCSVDPEEMHISLDNVPVSEDQVVEEVWTIECDEVAPLRTFVFGNSIEVATAYVYDPDPSNNTSHRLLTLKDPAGPEEDTDGDGLCDACDPCPVVPDCDGDGWNDGAEVVIGTDPLDACPDDPSDDAWPPDINNNGVVNILDVVRFREPIRGAYDCRYDLKTDGRVNILDVVQYRLVMHTSCIP